jgi:NMD protein affecting ribosome stability and mRNA decay
MAKKICRDCKKEFETKVTARYPRKYCDKCSKERKAAYEDLHNVTADDCDDE